MRHYADDTPIAQVVSEALKLLGEQLEADGAVTMIVYRSDHRLYRVPIRSDLYADYGRTLDEVTAAVELLSPLAVALVAPFHDPVQLSLPGSEHVALIAEDIDRERFSQLAEVVDGQDGRELRWLEANGHRRELERSLLAGAVSSGVGAGVFG